jgi:polysaccharide deacetylase family protein (PEP-CTERM system associated)
MTEEGNPAVAPIGDLANIDAGSPIPGLKSPAPAWLANDAVILSFDVEEHFRIEAAAGLTVNPSRQATYRERLASSTRWLLELLERREIKATFFILGHLARDCPDLVRSIHGAGHEIASHGWGHQRLHGLAPVTFREDVRSSKHALEDLTGREVLGYRAPTFSIVRRTAWAIDILAELGFLYDSSIYPVRHDRYGVPEAPRSPYLVEGPSSSLLEIPPLTWRLPGVNLPTAGGGYFRLFPPVVMECAIRQAQRSSPHPATMLYFHPWEFDPDQPKLPLRRLSRFRTYVGIKTSRRRLAALLGLHQFTHAASVARRLDLDRSVLPRFRLAE